MEIVNTKVPVVGGYSHDYTDSLKYPLVGFIGYPVAYSFEKNSDGTHLVVLFAAGGGLIKADVRVFEFSHGIWPQNLREINQISENDAKKISNRFNNYIKMLNEGGEFEYSTVRLLLTAINTEADNKACLTNHEGFERAEQLCAYKPSNEQLTPQQMLDKMKSFVTPIDEQNPAGSLDFGKYPTLSSEGNIFVKFGL